MKKHTKFREGPVLGGVTTIRMEGEREREREGKRHEREEVCVSVCSVYSGRAAMANGAMCRARQHNTLTWFETAPANPLDITCDSRRLPRVSSSAAGVERRRRRRPCQERTRAGFVKDGRSVGESAYTG